jgi:hypothetical protein
MNATDAARSRLASPTTVRILRWGGPVVAVAAFAIFWLERGLPLSRDMLVMWILLGLLALSLTNVKGWVRSVVLEWLPFLAILWVYDLLRGQADGLFFQAHVLPQLRDDEILGLGVAPTVRLQHWLWDGPFTIHWYDYVAWLAAGVTSSPPTSSRRALVRRARSVPALRRTLARRDDGVCPYALSRQRRRGWRASSAS